MTDYSTTPNQSLPQSIDLHSPIPLRAGPLSLLFENGGIRYIRWGEIELVRRIYIAVRDRNWGTVPEKLRVTRFEQKADRFEIVCEADCEQAEINFFWRGTIRGEPTGRITFEMDGEARSTFLRNRIGFCVLHPPRECRGTPCRIGMADSRILESRFPDRISPGNPFCDFVSIQYDAGDQILCRLDFEGETFEMEDQRNWADASFKTFGTPLHLPFPVEVAIGSSVRQSITLSVSGPGDLPDAIADKDTTSPVAIEWDTSGRRIIVPLGLGAASHGKPLTSSEVEKLRWLKPSHLRVDLRSYQPDYNNRLRTAASDARQLHVPLEIALFLSDSAEDELEGLYPLISELKPAVCRWLVFHRAETAASDTRWCHLARKHLGHLTPDAEWGTGTDHSFVEINRCPPPGTDLDFVCFSINPQVHAFDELSLIETLEMMPELVDCARTQSGTNRIVVSPVTLKMRSNPAATAEERAPSPSGLPSQVDPRQRTLFAAGWTLGCIKQLVAASVHEPTFYETTGWRGVLETEGGSPLPEAFPSRPGEVFPIYHVLADFNEFADGTMVPGVTGRHAHIEAILLKNETRQTVLIANLLPVSRKAVIPIEGLAGNSIRERRLNCKNITSATGDAATYRSQSSIQIFPTSSSKLELNLLPYELVRIDFET